VNRFAALNIFPLPPHKPGFLNPIAKPSLSLQNAFLLCLSDGDGAGVGAGAATRIQGSTLPSSSSHSTACG